MAITDWNDQVAQEMTDLVHQEGVSSFKLYMAYKNILQVNDGELLKALQQAGECEALVCVHCENGDVIDYLVEEARSQGKTAPYFHPLARPPAVEELSLIHISEPTRLGMISYAVFCLKKKKKT